MLNEYFVEMKENRPITLESYLHLAVITIHLTQPIIVMEKRY